MAEQLHLSEVKRVVVKVGSGLIAPGGGGCRARHMLPIAGLIAAWQQMGKKVVLVTSGAVAAGRAVRDLPGRRGSIPEKQALAAIGQTRLMGAWSQYFDQPCAQILLTHGDLCNRRAFVNIKNTLSELLQMGALPIVNENDTVAVEELKVGDNDNLAAYVAGLVEADLLLMLSDVDGLYDANPHTTAGARIIEQVFAVDAGVYALAKDTHNPQATGGMVTKIQAAEKATNRGIDTVIANGTRPAALEALIAGRGPGTLFHRTTAPITARKHWLRYTLPTSGAVHVDEGACQALRQGGASLLASGITAVSGDFKRGDAVEILHGSKPLAKGISQYSAEHLGRIKGRKSAEIPTILGFFYAHEIIHRSDMVRYSD